MPASSLAMFLFSCAVGALIQTTTGFGFGIVCMAIFPYILPSFGQSVAISSLCAAPMSSVVALRCRKHVNLKMILPLFAGYSLAVAWSIRYSKTQSEGLLIRLLGVVLILVSVYFIFFSNTLRIRPNFFNGFCMGIFCGIGAGMFGIGGPPAVIYLMSATQDKDEYRACSLAYFAIGSWYASGVRMFNGIINGQTVRWWMLALAALVVGVWAGNRLFYKINAKVLKRLVYGFMAISGLTMLF